MSKLRVVFHNELGPEDGELDHRVVEDAHGAAVAARDMLNTVAELYPGDAITVLDEVDGT